MEKKLVPRKNSIKKVIITGGLSGLGETLVNTFKDNNYHVICFDINEDTNPESLENYSFFKVDISNYQELASIYENHPELFSDLFAIVNNAGVIEVGQFKDQLGESWNRMIDVNIKGVLNICHIFGKRLCQNKAGSIVNIASTDGHVGQIGHENELGVIGVVAYASTKGAIISLTKALAVEWGDYNVRVNAVSPGLMKTPMTLGLMADPKKVAEYLRYTPINKLVSTTDIAETVLSFCRPTMHKVTGQVLKVDGGYSSHLSW